MNVKLLVGIALFVAGIGTAAYGIATAGASPEQPLIMTDQNTSAELENAIGNVAIPLVAGLALAIGGLLIGVSLGNWKNPRRHLEPGDEVVDPEGYQTMKHV